MELRYHGGALADRAAIRLDGARSYSPTANSQEVRLQRQRPTLVIVRPRQNDPFVSKARRSRSAICRSRIRADEQKDVADRRSSLRRGHAPPAHTLQVRSRRAARVIRSVRGSTSMLMRSAYLRLAISRARSRGRNEERLHVGGARASTNDGRPDSSPASAMKSPALPR